MSQPSITSTPTFAARSQRSEAIRVAIWVMVLSGLLVVTLVRRWAGGLVMSDGNVFYPYAGLLVFAIAINIVLLRRLDRANRVGMLLPRWVWPAGAAFDVAVAGGLMTLAAFLSPRGPVPALSSPAVLLMPLLVLTSVLRLRPRFTLYTGLACAAIHVLLTVRAIAVTDASPDTYPVYLAYGFILLLTTLAGAFVSREVRGHVKEASDEAVAHERSDRQLFGMRRDLAVARDIQRRLLPTRSPQLEGFDIVGMNRPADQTGGDYYDWQALPDGRLAVVLADVSGHGIGPALVMAVCRAYARAAVPLVPEPAQLLARLNTLLHDDLPSDRFITFALAVLEKGGNAQLISAGHGPTLLYRAGTRDVIQFGGDGMPLGVMPSEQYGPTTPLTLDAGDVLVMLTDGFFEWQRGADGEPFGIPRLCEALAANAAGDAQTILNAIDERVRAFCSDSPQADDMTAIVVKRTAPAARS